MKLFTFSALYLFLTLNIQAQTGRDIYVNYCSACHGQKLEGGRAPSLLNGKWKYGQSKKAIIKSISEGIPGTEMMAWKNMLTPSQIELVTDYLLSLKSKKG
jgi:cytochrome c oxidase cbb3-type subunit 3